MEPGNIEWTWRQVVAAIGIGVFGVLEVLFVMLLVMLVTGKL